jgi:hypothetical protein
MRSPLEEEDAMESTYNIAIIDVHKRVLAVLHNQLENLQEELQIKLSSMLSDLARAVVAFCEPWRMGKLIQSGWRIWATSVHMPAKKNSWTP